ncbi:hypothetical protein CBFG_01309 [Clostridiales bacterium 1_7_47FAA]|nr:hypothetical protein CBFG_01309 [Clostridiales bacterium 1_7_47FAA]
MVCCTRCSCGKTDAPSDKDGSRDAGSGMTAVPASFLWDGFYIMMDV